LFEKKRTSLLFQYKQKQHGIYLFVVLGSDCVELFFNIFCLLTANQNCNPWGPNVSQ